MSVISPEDEQIRFEFLCRDALGGDSEFFDVEYQLSFGRVAVSTEMAEAIEVVKAIALGPDGRTSLTAITERAFQLADSEDSSKLAATGLLKAVGYHNFIRGRMGMTLNADEQNAYNLIRARELGLKNT